MIGSVVGPHPYPLIVRDFQRVIGDETRQQFLKEQGELPGHVIACVGGGSNAIGMFTAFVDDEDVQLHGVEAAGEGLNTSAHAATLSQGVPACYTGPLRICCKMSTARCCPPTPSQPDWITRE